MIAAADGDLHIYMLNVGQGDTTIIVSPMGNVVVIDAKNASKMIKLLNDLGNDDKIEQSVGTRTYEMFGEATSDNVDLAAATPLDETNNPTDWQSLLEDRLANF